MGHRNFVPISAGFRPTSSYLGKRSRPQAKTAAAIPWPKTTETTSKNAEKRLGLPWYSVPQPQSLRHDADGNLAGPCYTCAESTFKRRVFLMTSPNPKQELMTLLNEQLCALEKQLYGAVSESEMQEYETRRDRIVELYNEVVEPPAAA